MLGTDADITFLCIHCRRTHETRLNYELKGMLKGSTDEIIATMSQSGLFTTIPSVRGSEGDRGVIDTIANAEITIPLQVMRPIGGHTGVHGKMKPSRAPSNPLFS